jgi:hypothetical protein
MEGMLHDFEQLALRYGLRQVRDVLAELRIRPGQKFFPQPDQVAGECEAMATKAKQEAAKNLPKLGCELCADAAPGSIGLVWEPRVGMPRGVLVPCKCRIAREKAKREVTA